MNQIPLQTRNVSITGTGSYLPSRVLTNAELEGMVDTSDDWIRTRTGMSERRIARDDEHTSDMAAGAARAALESAGIGAEDVDVIIVATITPDMMMPSTACLVQHLIGAKNAFCFDIEAACSGFLYAMETARGYLASGLCDTALVIGAEKMSAIVDWEDRATCILFGDGAGAAVLKAGGDEPGILASIMGADGSLADLLKLPAGGSRNPASIKTVEDRLHYLKMGGNQVFKHAVLCMTDAGQKVLDRCGKSMDDVACIIPHQANIRIIKAIADRAGVELDRFYINLDRLGNTTAATIPIALDEALRCGRVKEGDLVLFVAFGGGFTWGASLVRL